MIHALVLPRGPRPADISATELQVRLLEPAETPQALGLLTQAGIGGMTAELWHWRFHRDLLAPLVAAAFDADGRLLGLYPTVLRPLRLHGRDAWAAQACWTVVHPQFRWGGGVFRRLAAFVRAECERRGLALAYGGGVNPAAAAVGARLGGYQPFLALEMRERRLSWRLALGQRFGLAGLLAASVLDVGLEAGLLRCPGGLEFGVVTAAGAEFDDWWLRERDAWPIQLRRDARELDWRWLRCPVPATLLAARRGGRLLGFIAFRHHTEGSGRLTTVLDLACGRDSGLGVALLRKAARIAQRSGSDFLRFAPCPASPVLEAVQQRPWRAARKEADAVVVSWLPGARLGAARDWLYTQGDSDCGD